MKDKLKELEKEFDYKYDINLLVENAYAMINEMRESENCAIYDECNSNEIFDIKHAIVKYVGKEIVLNREGRYPVFILCFRFEGNMADYIYEIEYSSSGNISDDYFYKVIKRSS